MAIKLPSIFKSKPNSKSLISTPTKAAEPKPAPAKATKASKPAGPSFFDKILGKKPKVALGTPSNTAGPKSVSSSGGPSTNSGFNSTGDQTRKISAAIAANKVSKPKGEKGPFKLPIIGKYPTVTQFQVLGTLAGLCFVLMAIAIALYARNTSNLSTYTNISSQLQFHTQRLAKSGGLAARGDNASFPQLQDSRDQFQLYLNALNEGEEGSGFLGMRLPDAKISEELTQRLADLTKRHQDASNAATAILAAKGDLTSLGRNTAQVRAGADELAGLSQQLTVQLQASGVNPAQVLKVNRLTFLSERLARGAAEILGAEIIDPEVTFQMGKDTNDFRDLVKAWASPP
jgi:twitching motility protein PilJ